MNIYAEDLNYWKTGKSDPDQWMTKSKNEIKAVGGTITRNVTVEESGLMAYSLEFRIEQDDFKILWPVLHGRIAYQVAGDELATFISAALLPGKV